MVGVGGSTRRQEGLAGNLKAVRVDDSNCSSGGVRKGGAGSTDTGGGGGTAVALAKVFCRPGSESSSSKIPGTKPGRTLAGFSEGKIVGPEAWIGGRGGSARGAGMLRGFGSDCGFRVGCSWRAIQSAICRSIFPGRSLNEIPASFCVGSNHATHPTVSIAFAAPCS